MAQDNRKWQPRAVLGATFRITHTLPYPDEWAWCVEEAARVNGQGAYTAHMRNGDTRQIAARVAEARHTDTKCAVFANQVAPIDQPVTDEESDE